MIPICNECQFYVAADDRCGRCKILNVPKRMHDQCHCHPGNISAKDCSKLLHIHQKWRRGGKGKMLHPYLIGVAIDKALNIVRNI